MAIASFTFLMLGISVALIESRRRPDMLSTFVFVFSIQVIVPGILIPLILWAVGDNHALGNMFFDRVYRDVTGEIVALTSLLSGVFLLTLYVVFFFLHPFLLKRPVRKHKALHISRPYYLGLLIVGTVSSLVLLNSMPGASFLDKYFSLVLFRAQDESLAAMRTMLVANLFALTQTFAILSILGLLYIRDRGMSGNFLIVLLVLGMATFFGVMAASRRMLAIQAILIYFSYVLKSGKWNLKAVLLIAVVFTPVLIFGKDSLAQFAVVEGGDDVSFSFDSGNYWLVALNGLSSLGITLNSSWATFLYLDSMSWRLGMDHIVTVLRFLPLGSFGIDEDVLLPARIVRMSTEAFAGSGELDIPPGIIGQMWLDFGILGPVVWGLAFGGLLGWLQAKWVQRDKSFVGSGVFAILIFFVALPLNSGSLDFNFSIDMFVMLLLLYALVRAGRRVGDGRKKVSDHLRNRLN